MLLSELTLFTSLMSAQELHAVAVRVTPVSLMLSMLHCS